MAGEKLEIFVFLHNLMRLDRGTGSPQRAKENYHQLEDDHAWVDY
jgi:hypothetical protein